MHISKLLRETKKELPNLRYEQVKEVWKSYERELEQSLINPNELFVKFLNVGSFFMKLSALNYSTKRAINKSKNVINIDEDGKKAKAVISKIDRLIKLYAKRIEFAEEVIEYITGYSEEADKKVGQLTVVIRTYKDKIEQLKKFKDEFISEATSRHLEKQIPNSRGDQEQNIQEGTY